MSILRKEEVEEADLCKMHAFHSFDVPLVNPRSNWHHPQRESIKNNESGP